MTILLITDLMLIATGFFVLCTSIVLGKGLFNLVEEGKASRLWRWQLHMVGFFACAYLLSLFLISNGQQDSLEHLTSWIFFFGSIFVLIGVFITKQLVLEVSKRKKDLKIELDETRLKLLETKKIAALGTIAEATAHQVNNPLAIVLGSLEVLRRRNERGMLTPAFFEESYLEIKQASARIKQTIDDFQQYSLKYACRDVSCIDLVEELILLSEKYIEKLHHEKINLNLELPRHPVWVISSTQNITFILDAIIKNAIEALRVSNEDKYITLSIFESGEGVCLKIKNNGPPIPKAIIDKIFDPFFTTKPRRESRGVGLSSCKAMMISQDGDIQYVEEGELPCFEILFKTSKRKSA